MNIVPHVLKLENVFYSDKTFWLSTEPTEDMNTFLDNWKIGEQKITDATKKIDNLFVMNTIHSCFAHAVMDATFPYFWAMNDIREYEQKHIEFQLFVRQKEVLLFSQQNIPIIDSDNKRYKHAWNTLVETLSSQPVVFEHLLGHEEVFFIKTCYVYVKDDNHQRSAWNCITHYPDVHVQPKDVFFSDEMIQTQLKRFAKVVTSCCTSASSSSSSSITPAKTNIIVINRKTSYRNINDQTDTICEIIQRKCASLLMQKKYRFQGIVFLEDLTLAEQISIFQTNDVIIAPHGANLIHSMWFPNKTIIEIFFEERNNIMYKRICDLVGSDIIQIHYSNICTFLEEQF
jgi:hypothetical protein